MDIKKYIKENQLLKNKKPIKRHLFILCGEEDRVSNYFSEQIQTNFGVKDENLISLDLDMAMLKKTEFDNLKSEEDFDDFKRKTYWRLFEVAEDLIHQGYNIIWQNALLAKTLHVIQCARKANYIVVCVFPTLQQEMKSTPTTGEMFKECELLMELSDISIGYEAIDDRLEKIWQLNKRFQMHCHKSMDMESETCDTKTLDHYRDKVSKKFGSHLVKVCEKIQLKQQKKEEKQEELTTPITEETIENVY